MLIQTQCPACQARFSLADQLAGKTVRCGQCKQTFRIPKPESPPAEVPTLVEPVAPPMRTQPPPVPEVPEVEFVDPPPGSREALATGPLPSGASGPGSFAAPPPRPRPAAPARPAPASQGWVIAVVASSGGFLLLLSVGLLLWWILYDDRPARVVPKGPVAVGPGPGWDKANALDWMKKELKELDQWKDQRMFPDKDGFIDRLLPFDVKKPDGPFRDRMFPDKPPDDRGFADKRLDKEVIEKRVEPPPKIVPPVRPAVELRTIRSTQGDFNNLRFSPDGKVLATSNGGSQLQLWEADSGRLLGTLPFTPSKRPAAFARTALAFTPDSRQVAVWSGEGPVLVADATTGKQLHSLATDRSFVPLTSLDISPDGKTLVVCLGRSIKAWSLDTGNPVELPRNPKLDPKELVLSALFTSDTTLLTTSLSLAAKQREERLWNIKDGGVGEPLRLFAGGSPFTRVEVSPSRTVTYGGLAGNVEFSDAQTGKQLLRLTLPPGRSLSAANGVAFLPGERVIVTNHPDRSLTFWEFPSGRELRHVPLEVGGGGPGLRSQSGVAVSPDGRYLATLRDSAVTLWELNALLPRPEVPPR